MPAATKAKPDKNAKKKEQISPKDFDANAKNLIVSIDGQERLALPREFSTGSIGWHLSDKIVLKVGDVPVKVQATLSLTVIGSKPE